MPPENELPLVAELFAGICVLANADEVDPAAAAKLATERAVMRA